MRWLHEGTAGACKIGTVKSGTARKVSARYTNQVPPVFQQFDDICVIAVMNF
jgi:hypothetical protein